jgi:hypothetical protein
MTLADFNRFGKTPLLRHWLNISHNVDAISVIILFKNFVEIYHKSFDVVILRSFVIFTMSFSDIGWNLKFSLGDGILCKYVKALLVEQELPMFLINSSAMLVKKSLKELTLLSSDSSAFVIFSE